MDRYCPTLVFQGVEKPKSWEVMQMEECKLCGKDTPELFGPYCALCDKIVGDVNAGLVAEFEPGEGTGVAQQG
jgi:hypothetical protein